MNKPLFRTERDSMGELQVPSDALYGPQTQRAIQNFPVSGLSMPTAFTHALGLIKASAAEVNADLGLLDQQRAQAIVSAAEKVALGHFDDQFPVDVFQTGSGTSSNMNANEVIANLAEKSLDLSIHPNDHVNMGQSSNDVIPTAIHVSATLALQKTLLPALQHLQQTLLDKAKSLKSIVKTGRTHLMDAMPVTLGQELGGWAAQISAGERRIRNVLPSIRALTLGGTAVGTGINAHPEFSERFVVALSARSGYAFQIKENFFEGLSAQDAAVELSGQLKVVAVSLMKIANDLRWMNSGPLTGLGEIALPALQPGSSIMPGKINPVIPESVAMVAAQVIGNDVTLTIAGQSGNFQLNVMLPVIAFNLLQSIDLLSNATRLLADKALRDFTVQKQHLRENLDRNPILVTALNQVIGYEQGAAIAKQAYREGRSVFAVAKDNLAVKDKLSEQELRTLLDPLTLTNGGIAGS